MRPFTTAVGTAFALAACTHPTRDPSEARVNVTVLSCLHVGYGLSCGAEVQGGALPAGRVRVQSCVADGDGQPRGLYGILAAVAEGDAGNVPGSMSLKLEPAADAGRTCGVLYLPTGEGYRIVDFGH